MTRAIPSARIVAVFALIYLGLSAVSLRGPFVRHWEQIAASNAIAARNQVRFGYATTRFGMLAVSGERLEPYGDLRGYYYVRHPMIVSTCGLSLFFRLFGSTEWAYRLCLLLVGVANILLFHRLARRCAGESAALFATGGFTLCPLFSYFSQVVPELGFTMMFVLAMFIAYWAWLDSGRKRYLGLVAGFSFLACLSDWMGYGAGLVIAVHQAFIVKRNRWVAVFALAMNVAWFAAYLGYCAAIDPAHHSQLRALLGRGGSATRGILSIGLFRYLRSEGRELLIYATPAVLALLVPWLARFARNRSPVQWFVLLLVCLGLYEFVFFELAFVHDFHTFGLMPFLFLGAALGLEVVGRRGRAWKWGVGAAACLLVLGQDAVILRNRMTRMDPRYENCRRMGSAIRERTDPSTRVVVVSDNYDVPAFYADRYLYTYVPEHRELYGGLGPAATVRDVGPREAIQGKFDLLVTEREEAWIGSLDPVGKESVDGFLFFRLR